MPVRCRADLERAGAGEWFKHRLLKGGSGMSSMRMHKDGTSDWFSRQTVYDHAALP